MVSITPPIPDLKPAVLGLGAEPVSPEFWEVGDILLIYSIQAEYISQRRFTSFSW